MKGLVCAATPAEIQGVLESSEGERTGTAGAETAKAQGLWRFPWGYAAVTGVGIPATLLRLPSLLDSLRPDWILNLGLAGAYPDRGLELGDIIIGTSETFADLGMEMPDEEGFRPLSRFPFADPLGRDPIPLRIPSWLAAATPDTRRGKGASVNCCTGRAATGVLRSRLFDADFESMEGAAVALAGAQKDIPVSEARAISNFASDRDMRPENVDSALMALRTFWMKTRERLP